MLEVLLAMTLAAAVLAALSTALYLHLYVVEQGRGEVEEALLARVVLGRVADDLRSAIRHDDSGAKAAGEVTSSLTGGQSASSLAQQASGSTGTGSTSGTSGGTSGGTSSGSTSGSSSSSSNSSSSADGQIVPHTVAGLYGTQFELEVDISRLPRPDEYGGILQNAGQSAAGGLAAPTDVRTVAYYMASAASGTPTQADGQTLSGLVRREVDRAAGRWAYEQGDVSSVGSTMQVLAPEVTALEFRYFDGTEWWTEWDSDEKTGLPMAIEMTIAITSTRLKAPTPPAAGNLQQATAADGVYRLLVNLPAAEPTDSSNTSTTDSSSESSSSTGKSTSGSTSNATQTP